MTDSRITRNGDEIADITDPQATTGEIIAIVDHGAPSSLADLT